MDLCAAGVPDLTPAQPEALEVTTAAADRRLILPSALEIQLSSLSALQAQDLADQVSRLVEQLLCRAPWRQAYIEQLAGPGGAALRLSRWPIEGEAPTGAAAEDPPAVDVVGGSAVALDTYRVVGANRREVYRDALWLYAGQAPPRVHYEATYTAGYLMPGQIGEIVAGRHVMTWQASTAYATGQSHAYGDDRGSWVLPTTPNGAVFEVTVSGTTGGSEPSWDTAIGATTNDNSVAFTAHPDYILLPELARQALIALAGKTNAANNAQSCPADCEEAEEMLRKAFGGLC